MFQRRGGSAIPGNYVLPMLAFSGIGLHAHFFLFLYAVYISYRRFLAGPIHTDQETPQAATAVRLGSLDCRLRRSLRNLWF